MNSQPPPSDSFTPIEIVANVSRVVSKAVEQATGDRSDVPLLVAMGVVEALSRFEIPAMVMYGQAAWVEILEDQTPIWSGCWGENYSFWAATQTGEVIDLNTSVAHRKRSHQDPSQKSMVSPPMLWSRDLPRFFRYQPAGIAEVELTEKRDIDRLEQVFRKIDRESSPQKLKEQKQEFANEAILCPNRQILDDSKQSFQLFDRALATHPGWDQAPF